MNLAESGQIDLNSDETKVLDFGVCNGEVGETLSRLGLTEVYGQEGSAHLRKRSMKKGHYKAIASFIVGKQAMPSNYARKFDIVSCSGNLGVGLMPSQGLNDMVKALKQGGYAVFSINEKLLDPKTDKGTGYSQEIQKLIDNEAWKPVASVDGADDRSKIMIF